MALKDNPRRFVKQNTVVGWNAFHLAVVTPFVLALSDGDERPIPIANIRLDMVGDCISSVFCISFLRFESFTITRNGIVTLLFLLALPYAQRAFSGAECLGHITTVVSR
ncbi:hypothetical protein ACPTKM_19405 [Pseudomonas aeruginosa]|uniref:hypothetical protein n=1 Tax=Pseudomonas aeruginosa TaxID=287 RepID=UPI000F82FDB5|nr:hypothetical protein [Pseudomonas aeruginosa]RTW74889.1 hypothetical protein DZA09_10335 [Pseudomonas aeruginosa]